jgi:xanthine dehydrogenase accessory factor
MDGMGRFIERVAALRREGQPFVVATVVARRAPVSAHLGDRALVFADGHMEGFVGGACSREIVRTQALQALGAGRPRLVCIRPDAAEAHGASDERVVVPMTCASEGAVDVYLEPMVPPRRLVVAGATPVADALARLAQVMQYEVVRVVEPAERRDVDVEAAAIGARVEPLDRLAPLLAEAGHGGAAVVVASQGHYDEPALEAALKSPAGYIGLVASRKRGESVRAWLASAGAPGLDRLRNPAGLDLGGRSAPEVALSILAELVQLGSALSSGPGHAAAPAATPSSRFAPTTTPAVEATAVDPVCHMDVQVAGARHTAEVGGVTYYFCCGGCRTRFVANPQQYLAATP